MPLSSNIKITIDDKVLDLGIIEELPLGISYSLEDRENFQQKNSSRALDIEVPASVDNDQISNTFHNPSVEDLTKGTLFKENRKGIIEVNGQELLVGKAFLVNATHSDRPLKYVYNFYGNNGDWIIDLKESTLHDWVKDIIFTFTKANIVNSWGFDGNDRAVPYVFAPVRYGQTMETFVDVNGLEIEDYNMKADYMRPALSKYWIIYKAFKSLGYRVKSDFMDSPYFRRQVMPWTWGNFLISDGTRLDVLDFLAKSDHEYVETGDEKRVWNLNVINDSTNGAFDNNNVYTYDAVNYAMQWTYQPAFDFGKLMATFHLNLFINAKATNGSRIRVRAQWFKNGLKLNHGNDDGNGTLLLDLDAKYDLSTPLLNNKTFLGPVDDWATIDVMPSDVVSCKIWIHTEDTFAGTAKLQATVDAFEIDYFRIPLGGKIDFENYQLFKKHKFLDYFAGVVDEFNLCIQTDSVNKVIYIEPQHPYSIINSQAVKSGGYFNGNFIDWSDKQDLSKESEIELFSNYERELSFKYKDDNNDGTFKIMQDRNANKPALAKYVFPDRFKAGLKEIENRFFSAVMHYDVIQWKGIGADVTAVPQMICLIPENISNTSRDEAQNIFEPKSAYYKGIIPGIGWIFDGELQHGFPYMFAVNYMTGGENDPILSYCDEQIGPDNALVTGKGLLRRFYLQRLAIMRNGQYYKTYFHLNNSDIANILHREHIICRGQKWELVDIVNYNPIKEESTEVHLRKWSPIKNA